MNNLSQLQFTEQLLELHNQMRTEPASFIPDLEQMLPFFGEDGKTLYIPTGENEFMQMEMVEGRQAVVELIDFLRTASPVEKLEWDQNVAKAAKDHVEDTGMEGVLGHIGKDGSNPFDRLERYTKAKGNCAESLNYGDNAPKDVLLMLAIDDGVQSRGHRKNIMNPSFTRFGCHQGYHSAYHSQAVCVYSGTPEAARPFEKLDHDFDMTAFMAENVNFEDEPADHDGFTQTSQSQFDAEVKKATKTIKRVYKMKEGMDVVREVTVSKLVV